MSTSTDQLSLPMLPPTYKWGGRREGAGRPRITPSRGLPHRARPFHEHSVPVHITWRVARDLPSLRDLEPASAIGRGIRKAMVHEEKRGTSFRVVHFSIQAGHLHLIAEAGSKATLARGMRGLGVRLARAVNAAIDRRGQVFVDRYHARELNSPTEVRRAIVYVLQNHRHHRPAGGLVDPLSSARWFTGWERRLPAPSTPCPVRASATWLGEAGWRRLGLIRFTEGPAS